jgi:hypothetical protein
VRVLGVEDEVRARQREVARSAKRADGALLLNAQSQPLQSKMRRPEAHENSPSERAPDRNLLAASKARVKLLHERPAALILGHLDELEAVLGQRAFGVLGELDEVESVRSRSLGVSHVGPRASRAERQTG